MPARGARHRGAWLCAAADGNMAQVKAAFDAQRFDPTTVRSPWRRPAAARRPEAPAEKAKKPAAKKAAKTSVNDKSEPKKRGP